MLPKMADPGEPPHDPQTTQHPELQIWDHLGTTAPVHPPTSERLTAESCYVYLHIPANLVLPRSSSLPVRLPDLTQYSSVHPNLTQAPTQPPPHLPSPAKEVHWKPSYVH